MVESTIARCLQDGSTLLFFSSAAIYGGPNCRGREDEPAAPPTRYGRHKLDLERSIEGSGVRHLSVRLGYVQGKDTPHYRLVPSLINQLRSGHVTVHRGALRDLIHVDDVLRILDALLAAGAMGTFNVASGRCVPIEHIIDHLEERLNLRANRRYVDVQTTHCPALEKLRSALPKEVHTDFPPNYFRAVIDSYLNDAKELPSGSQATQV